MLDAGATITYLEHLVDLFLVLDQGHFDIGIVEHIGHFIGHRVLVKRHRDCAQSLRRGHAPVKPGAVVADDG